MRIGRILFLIAILICAAEMARLWSLMPDPVAAHFNIQGAPDRFVSKPQFFWFQLQTLLVVVLVSLPIQALFLVLPAGLIHMPHRDYWLAPERRAETVQRLSDFGALMFAVILLAIQAAFEISAYANLHTPIVFDATLMGIVMAVCIALVVLMLISLIFSFRLKPSVD